jgi:hypothetical protein
MNAVPASVAIRRSRVSNIDNDRLIRRLNYIHEMFLRPESPFPNRLSAAYRAAEQHVIEQELIHRNVVSENVLRAAAAEVAYMASY